HLCDNDGMRHRLFTLAAGGSFIAALAVTAIWLMTLSSSMTAGVGFPGGSYTFNYDVVHVSQGIVELYHQRSRSDRMGSANFSCRTYTAIYFETHFGFDWQFVNEAVTTIWRFDAPCWLIAFATMILPLARAVWWVKERHRRGHNAVLFCDACGYDLRGSP